MKYISKPNGRYRYILWCDLSEARSNIQEKIWIFWVYRKRRFFHRKKLESVTAFVSRIKNETEKVIEKIISEEFELKQAFSIDKIELIDELKKYS